MFTKLTNEQLKQKCKFIDHFINSKNAADGSTVDANANLTVKSIAAMEHEMFKDFNIQLNRKRVMDKLDELYGPGVSASYLENLKNHFMYAHDETSSKPYCCSVTMYPFLLKGTKDIGGESIAPKHLHSFAGSFVNLMYILASHVSGAVAVPEFFLCFDHFAAKDLGDNYLETNTNLIKNYFQEIIYCLNQPASARGGQSVFSNFAIFDKYFMKGLFEHFVFPDGTIPDFDRITKLQMFFLDWFNKERTREVLTFPVVTVAMLAEGDKMKDDEFALAIAKEMNKGNSFFIYVSKSVDSLSSCCRLRNEISDNTFSYTLGAVGVMTGSVRVITINMNRFVQKVVSDFLMGHNENKNSHKVINHIKEKLKLFVKDIHKYHVAHRKLLEEFDNSGMMPTYKAGFISMSKQYSTIGLNGIAEAAEFMGYEISNNHDYIHFVSEILKVIYEENKAGKKEHGCMFNTEFVPAENLGVKNSKWDRDDDYHVKRDCYNSYLYLVEDENINVLDKFVLHGEKTTKYLDGGSALHLNLEEHLTQEQYLKLFEVAAKTGCNYFCVNVKSTYCNDCTFIDKQTKQFCVKCGSRNVSYLTRIIGYLKKIDNFSSDRQFEAKKRFYHREQKYNEVRKI